MPIIYLSPSTQEYNKYVTGGTEEEYMNLLADKMEPYLISSGIRFVRNTPEMTAASSIIQSNMGNYDLHLALHSNAAPEHLAGRLMGTDVYYYPRSIRGKEAAETIAANFRTIYPYPELVNTLPTTSIGEVRRTKAPSVLIEVAYHDNYEDEAWLKNNLDEIAVNIVQSLTQFFGIPFIPAQGVRTGYVITESTPLNIRSYPSFDSEIIGSIPKGAEVNVVGQYEDWYTVNYGDILGYALASYIKIK